MEKIPQMMHVNEAIWNARVFILAAERLFPSKSTLNVTLDGCVWHIFSVEKCKKKTKIINTARYINWWKNINPMKCAVLFFLFFHNASVSEVKILK